MPKTILVVDGEAGVRELLTTELEGNGLATRTAKDGAEVLTEVAEHRPDLITLDITMPENSGVGAYRALKTSDDTKDIPVLIVTGVSRDFEKFISSRSKVPAPEGYLAKPVEPEDLLAKVAELLG